MQELQEMTQRRKRRSQDKKEEHEGGQIVKNRGGGAGRVNERTGKKAESLRSTSAFSSSQQSTKKKCSLSRVAERRVSPSFRLFRFVLTFVFGL
mmetsp:Transcript_29342/g.57595  ORF Transcript_29342/g.57595 Transcript_29342/m.57595 type:complete len:94 (+) Transcript_29342:2349-2630(+)